MSSCIYYFSGTGNSFSIAQDLAFELEDARLVSIPEIIKEKSVFPSAETVGIVYPVYAFGIPLMVGSFIKKLSLEKSQYVFTVANYAKLQGAGITKAHRLLKRKGITPKAGFEIRMPNSYLPFGEAVDEEEQRTLFEKKSEKVKRIARAVRDKKKRAPETGFFLARWLVAEPICFLSALMMKKEDRNFTVSEKCNGCGVCRRICPAENIELSGSKPFWRHDCELCMACLSWCEEKAIDFGKRTKGKKRYRHPRVRLEDMLIR